MPPRRRRTRWRVDSWGIVRSSRLEVKPCIREPGLVYMGGDAMVAYLLNVVVAQGTAILKLLAGEDETLLVGWDAFFILDLAFHVVDGVGGLDLKCDGLTR